MVTTLNKIRPHHPCASGWAKLLKHLGKTQPDDEPVLFSVIVESNGLDDALRPFARADLTSPGVRDTFGFDVLRARAALKSCACFRR
jgi:hypothetical protein